MHIRKVIVFVVLTVIVSAGFVAEAQIVSIDKRRTRDPNRGLQGEFNLGFNFIHTTTDQKHLNSRMKLQYNEGQNTYLFSSDVGFNEVGSERNVNNGGLMLKYNYWVPEKIIIAEGFLQYQYNRVKSLKHRYIFGGGPRFNIADRDRFSFFIVGYTIYLNELYEHTEYERRKSLVKFSSMGSFDWRISDAANISHTTYYEPDYSDPSDFRIWSESRLNLKISQQLNFGLFIKLEYDNMAPPDVDKLFYTVSNSFQWRF
jgi:putative salt-induced outer membrane protein YdiY